MKNILTTNCLGTPGLLASLIALIVLPFTAVAETGVKRLPNVVLIVADDLGIGDVGCYGSAKISTPSLDRLASQGVRALDVHATSSVCTPSRYAMLTGRYYYQDWNGDLLVKPGQATIASVLHDNGYATGYFGKWHLGWGKNSKDRRFRSDIDWNRELPAGVLECGFDTFFGTPFTHNESPSVFVLDRHVVGLEPNDPLVMVPPDPKQVFGQSSGAKKAHEARPDSQIDLIVIEKAKQWITNNQAKPFFLNLALAAPHTPINPAKEFRGRSGVGLYGDFVVEMDWCVGQILQLLDDCGVANNTLVIFTSDNGAKIHKEMIAQEHRSNLKWLGQKTDVWEGGVRIPLIVRWPGRIPAGTTTDAMISLSDLAKTVWDAVGVKAPEGAAIDSISQLSVWEKPSSAPVRKEMLYLGTQGLNMRAGRWVSSGLADTAGEPATTQGFALRSSEWVYIPGQGSRGVTTDLSLAQWMHLHDIGQTNSDYDNQGRLKEGAPKQQLYNLRDDPSQTRNVIRDFPEMAASLEKRFNELLQALKDRQ
jgi:arylsulfatase A-like enzyme